MSSVFIGDDGGVISSISNNEPLGSTLAKIDFPNATFKKSMNLLL